MATLTVTVTDTPGGAVTAVVESKRPPLPFLSADGELDFARMTSAQAAGVGMVMWLADNVADCDYRTLLRDDEDVSG